MLVLKNYIFRLWVSLTVSVLVLSLYYYDGKPNSDIDVFLIWSMIVLTLPFGILIALLLGGFYYFCFYLFSVTFHSSYFHLLVTWTVFFLAGYLQWVKLFPYFVNKVPQVRKFMSRSKERQ